METSEIGPFTGQYAFLSNFYIHPITYKGISFKTNEHAYQAAKAKDAVGVKDILNCQTPGAAKKRGRRILMRSDWEIIKDRVMLDINRIKFQDKRLQSMLIDTYPSILIEKNYWKDEYWGVCNGKGLNKLGVILMNIRSELI